MTTGACIWRFKGDCGSRRWREHGVITALHAGNACLRHVTGDAHAAPATWLVVSMLGRVLNIFAVAGQTCIIGLCSVCEPEAATGRMALETMKLPGLYTGAHEPPGIGVVLTQISAIRVEIRVFQCREVIVVKEALTRGVGRSNRRHPGVAWCTCRVNPI